MMGPITHIDGLEVNKLYRVVLVDDVFGTHDEGQTRIIGLHRAVFDWQVDSVSGTKGAIGVANVRGGWRRLFYPVPDYVQSVGRGI